MDTPYQHMQSPQNVGSGLTGKFMFAPVADFEPDGIKAPVEPFVNLGDEVTITTPHTFKANKGFVEVITAPWKNKLNVDSIGEAGSMKMDQKLEVVVTGSYKELHATVKKMLNSPMIILAPDSDDPSLVYQLGTKHSPAYITAAPFETGTEKEGQKSYKIGFSAPSKHIQLYAGTIALAP